MKHPRHFLVGLSLTFLLLLAPAAVSAQMMMGQSGSSSSDTSEVQKGAAVYSQLQNKQTTCSKLTDDDFDVLGDFYMARMMGSAAHSTMDQQMSQHIGDAANTQMHIAFAKRLSGCDPNANYPASAANYAPAAGMTGMMGSGNMMDSGTNMMGYSNSSWSGRDTVLSVLLLVAVVAAIFGWMRPGKSSLKKR